MWIELQFAVILPKAHIHLKLKFSAFTWKEEKVYSWHFGNTSNTNINGTISENGMDLMTPLYISVMDMENNTNVFHIMGLKIYLSFFSAQKMFCSEEQKGCYRAKWQYANIPTWCPSNVLGHKTDYPGKWWTFIPWKGLNKGWMAVCWGLHSSKVPSTIYILWF